MNTNAYFTTDDKRFFNYGNRPNPARLRAVKFNNMYVLTIISKLHVFDNKFTDDYFIKKYMATILSGNLLATDTATGFNSNDLGGKVKFLVRECSKEEGIKKFRNSFFNLSLFKLLYDGNVRSWGNEGFWSNYENKKTDEKTIDMNALNGALHYYLNDINTPVGLDLSRLFDAIVDKDKNGNYYIVENLDIEKQEEMINAVEMFIQLLRANPKFKEHFSNSLVSELE